MNCHRCQHLLLDHSDSRPDQSDRDEVESHLARCPKCRELFLCDRTVGLELGVALRQASGDLKLAPDVRRKIVQSATGNGRPVHPLSWVAQHRVALLGAACLLIAFGVVLPIVLRDAPPRHAGPDRPIDSAAPTHRVGTHTQMFLEVRGGRTESFWLRRDILIRTRNGSTGYLKVSATWPKRKSTITLATRNDE